MKSKRPVRQEVEKREWTPIPVNMTAQEIEITHSKLLEVAQGMGFMRDKLTPPQWEITKKIGVIYRAIRDAVEDIESHRNTLMQTYAVKKDGEITRNEEGGFRLLQPDYRIADGEFMREKIQIKLPLWRWSELEWLHGVVIQDTSVESIVLAPLMHIVAESCDNE